MVFIDSNIPMYVIGAEHPNKRKAQILLERLIREKRRLATDAEAYQEILHRCTAIDRREAIEPAYELPDSITDVCYPVEQVDIQAAKAALSASERLSARDAVHLAAMQRRGISEIAGFDGGFDAVKGPTRPAE